MPTYPYRCEGGCGEFDLIQRITEPAKKKCPTCGAKVERLIGGGCGAIVDSDRLWDMAPTPNDPRGERKSDLKKSEAYLIGVAPRDREKYRRLRYSDSPEKLTRMP